MILSCDIEANGLLDEADRMWCLCAKDYSTGETYKFSPDTLEEGLDLIQTADVTAWHNGTCFDEPLIKKLYPQVKLKKTVDTLVMSRVIWTDIHEREGIGNQNVPSDLITSHGLAAWGYRLGRGKPEHEAPKLP